MGRGAAGHCVDAGREGATWLGIAAVDGGPAEEVRDVEREPFAGVGQLFEQLGVFGIALAFVLVSMHAMRVGLLTRFMGILGIIVGALMILPLDEPQLIRTFWLVSLGLLIAGRGRKRPPAWATGRAQPWPSQQQIREQRLAAAGHAPAPEAVPDEPAPAADATAAPAKRKRKKRK
jgi:hypothetical protein